MVLVSGSFSIFSFVMWWVVRVGIAGASAISAGYTRYCFDAVRREVSAKI
jgi:hypothetical protein